MKSRHIILASVLVTAASVSLADEEQFATLRVGTNIYTKVTITSATTTDTYFMHSWGMGDAKVRDLEPATQKHFHFDPEKAAARQRQQAAENGLYGK